MLQRFVYDTSRLVVTQNHLIFIVKIFVFKGPLQKYVGQWLGNVLYRNVFQRIPEGVKWFRQNGCCCDHSTLCESYWRQTAQEFDKDEDEDGLTSTVLCTWFEGYVSVNDCLVLGYIFPKWKGEEFRSLLKIVSPNSITILFNLRMRKSKDAGFQKLHRPVKNFLLMEVIV